MSQIQSEEEEKKSKEFVHTSVDVDVHFSAPSIFIAEDYYTMEGKSCLIVDLGVIKLSSDIVPINKEDDFSKYSEPKKLYDAYQFELSGIEVSAIEGMVDYKSFKTNQNRTTILNDISISSYFLNSIWPSHSVFPSYEIAVSLDNCTITVSDYLVQFLQRLSRII